MRYITLFAEAGALDWQFHISENRHELIEVERNLEARGIKRKTIYTLGDEVKLDEVSQ